MDTWLSSYMGYLKDQPIENLLYTYDTSDGTTIVLEHNNNIYMGDMMKASLAISLLSEDNSIHIDIRPQKYYPDESGAQTVTLPYGTIIPILYYGVQPYIHVWRPTSE